MTELEFWNHALDQLRQRLSPPTDVQLSYMIRLSPAMISQIRTNRRAPPFHVKLKLLEELGYEFDHDLLIRLLPIEDRKLLCHAMARGDHKAIEKLKSKNSGKELPPMESE